MLIENATGPRVCFPPNERPSLNFTRRFPENKKKKQHISTKICLHIFWQLKSLILSIHTSKSILD